MSSLSQTPTERARKAYSIVLQAMQDPGSQRNVAQVLGVSESTVSRIKTEKLEDSMALIYQLGFKVVPQDVKCYSAEYVASLHTLARMQMAQDTPVLEWEDSR